MNRITIGEESSRTNREKEVYRTLRTNIEFTGVENRAIAITSCTPNDGKRQFLIIWHVLLRMAERKHCWWMRI